MESLLNMELNPLQMGLSSLATNFLLLVSLAGLAFPLVFKLNKKSMLERKLNKKDPKAKEVRREMLTSFRTVLVTSVIGVLVGWGTKEGILKMYFDPNEHGIAYLIFCIPLLVVLNDAYFYWTHRMMHLKFFYKRVHAVHHLSVNPSPWAAYSFGLLEAVINGIFLPIVLLVIPVHPIAVFLWLVVMMAYNVFGHCGYEVLPKKLYDKGITNIVSHHQLHHKNFNYNYGLYFPWWDRLMKTEDPAMAAGKQEGKEETKSAKAG